MWDNESIGLTEFTGNFFMTLNQSDVHGTDLQNCVLVCAIKCEPFKFRMYVVFNWFLFCFVLFCFSTKHYFGCIVVGPTDMKWRGSASIDAEPTLWSRPLTTTIALTLD